jgi:hypothetical protein
MPPQASHWFRSIARAASRIRRFRCSRQNVGKYEGVVRAFSASLRMYERLGDVPRPGFALRQVDSANGSSVSSAAQITPKCDGSWTTPFATFSVYECFSS